MPRHFFLPSNVVGPRAENQVTLPPWCIYPRPSLPPSAGFWKRQTVRAQCPTHLETAVKYGNWADGAGKANVRRAAERIRELNANLGKVQELYEEATGGFNAATLSNRRDIRASE